MTKAREIYDDAIALFERLPVSKTSAATQRLYLKTFALMMAEPDLDPLRPGDARDTYNVRRAALHAGTRTMLKHHIDAFDAGAQAGDSQIAMRALHTLERLVERCGPAIERDPPLSPGQSSFDSPASRWAEAQGPKPRRGNASKKHELKHLPRDWREQLWNAASAKCWKYLDALAVHVLCPVRPSEFLPGRREGRKVEGVVVRLKAHVLSIVIAPAKSHDGQYGTGESQVHIDARHGHPAIAHLVALCRTSGGSIVVSLKNTNGMRKALQKLGLKVLGSNVVVTGYLFRHQYLADLKSTAGAGEHVAAAAGHCTDRTQARYGRVEHGRRRVEFIAATAVRPPICGNVERAASLKRALAAQAPRSGFG